MKSKSYLIGLAICSIAGLALTQTVLANTQATPFNNVFYLGVRGGFMQVKPKASYKEIRSTGTTITKNAPVRSSSKGKALSLVGGYGTTFNNNLYIGGEVSGTLFSKPGLSRTHTRLYGKHAFSMDVLPGFVVNKRFLIYGRIGATMERYQLERYTAAGKSYRSTSHKNDLGLRLGIGAEYLLTQHLGINANYTHVMMKAFKMHQKGPDITTAKPQYNIASLGLNYYF